MTAREGAARVENEQDDPFIPLELELEGLESGLDVSAIGDVVEGNHSEEGSQEGREEDDQALLSLIDEHSSGAASASSDNAASVSLSRLAELIECEPKDDAKIIEGAIGLILQLQEKLTRPDLSEFDPAAHNILREVILEAERRLRNIGEHPEDVADFLAEAAKTNLIQLDADEIVIDFDSGPQPSESQAAALLAKLGIGRGSGHDPDQPASASARPVDAALLRAVSLHDEIAARRIAGIEAGDDLHEEYQKALLVLHREISRLAGD